MWFCSVFLSVNRPQRWLFFSIWWKTHLLLWAEQDRNKLVFSRFVSLHIDASQIPVGSVSRPKHTEHSVCGQQMLTWLTGGIHVSVSCITLEFTYIFWLSANPIGSIIAQLITPPNSHNLITESMPTEGPKWTLDTDNAGTCSSVYSISGVCIGGCVYTGSVYGSRYSPLNLLTDIGWWWHLSHPNSYADVKEPKKSTSAHSLRENIKKKKISNHRTRIIS